MDKTSTGSRALTAVGITELVKDKEAIFILSGLISNRKGHLLVHRWFSFSFTGTQFMRIEQFETLLARTGLATTRFPNRENDLFIDIRFLYKNDR